MKIISLSILSISLCVSLFARENPFEPTDHYLEQKEMVIKANELEQIKKEQEAADLIAEEMKEKELEAQKIADAKALEMQIKKEKEMQKLTVKEEPIIEEVYIPEIKENFRVLPYVKIYVINDVLTIKVDPKYKLLNQDILKPAKKLLFDFEGKVSFYTIRKDIISEDFKSLTVGTHMEEEFFRVVIDVPEDIINYVETIDSKNGIITIMKKK
ncbi:hypothetical protein OAR97_07865 [Arcobacteraceae bacterium]|nr:hypothetical protein [Arcobacteraceae bacterium]